MTVTDPTHCRDGHRFEGSNGRARAERFYSADRVSAGRPGQRPDGRPEYAPVDTMGDKKVDIKIVFNFTGKTNLWIFYANRDRKSTAFGYGYDGKGKPDRVVAIGAALQR